MSTRSSPKNNPSTPPSPNPKNLNENQEIDSFAIITNVVPVSIIHPSTIEKKNPNDKERKYIQQLFLKRIIMSPPTSTKKEALKPVIYGPKKGWSKSVTAPEKKKKSLKRNEPPSSDSEYDFEEDVPHISESEQEEKQDVEQDVPNIGKSDRKVIRRKNVPQGIADVPMDNVSLHSLESVHRWKFAFNRRLALETS
jgi:hypothetical protein